MSPDGGSSWTSAGEGLPPRFVWALAVDRNSTVYAATDGGVFRKRASRWIDVSKGLPFWRYGRTPALALIFDPDAPERLYTLTQAGVYRRVGGSAWAMVGGKFPNPNVRALALDRKGSTLYAGTAGGGVYTLARWAGRTEPGCLATAPACE